MGGYFEYGDWRWMWADCTPSWNDNLWSPFYPASVIETSLCLIHHRGTQNWEFSAGCSSKNSYVCSKKICPGIYQLDNHFFIIESIFKVVRIFCLFGRQCHIWRTQLNISDIWAFSLFNFWSELWFVCSDNNNRNNTNNNSSDNNNKNNINNNSGNYYSYYYPPWSPWSTCRLISIGPKSDHCLALSVSQSHTHSLMFLRLDWCDPGVWRYPVQFWRTKFLSWSSVTILKLKFSHDFEAEVW